MKRFLAVALLFVCSLAFGQAPPIYRSPFTTNAAPQTNTHMYGAVVIEGTTNSYARLFGLYIDNPFDDVNPLGFFWDDGTSRFQIYGGNITNALAFVNFANVTFDVTTTTTANVSSLAGGGGTFSQPVLSTSSSTNAPAETEFVTGGWVRGLFAGTGVEFFSTTNIATIGTNVGSGLPLYTLTTNAAPFPAVLTFAGVTNGQYLYASTSTNPVQQVTFPIVLNGYISFPSGGGRTLTAHGEVYFSYDRTNWFGDVETANQTITGGSTNLYQFTVSFPTVTSTQASGLYVQGRLKVGTQTANPNVSFWVGTNTASHIDINLPSATAGNAFLAANQTFTGSNIFTKTVNLTSLQWTPYYSNSVIASTNIYAVFGQHETIVDVQTNGVCFLLSTNRLSNVVASVNFTLKNFCGSNAVVTMNPSWIPLGTCTNNVILTNAKVMRLSVLFASRAVAGWDSETNVIFGYAFQP